MSTQDEGDKKQDWAGLVERRIREAMERGAFRDLPGRGAPLDLRRNPFLGEDMEMAYKILQDSGFAPEWIEASRDMRARVADWRWRLRAACDAYSERAESHEAEEAWRRTWERLQVDLNRLNKEIDALNLKMPMAWLHRPRLRAEQELQRARQDRSRNPTDTGEDT